MKDIALQPAMRKLWKAINIFKVPITHPYIQSLTDWDLEFIDWSSALDNPSFYDKMINTVYDEEYDEYEEEAEKDVLTEEEKAIMEDIINKASKPSKPTTSNDDFTPMGDASNEDPGDWVEV